ncbi:MAG: aminotransferase class V-fold PLP-dependent enzyme [Polyangiaceae bacterium]|nr:aminotransferase class V-fold PLP-dependent enzyme [Polyangiaceae bacterium]
MSRTGDISFAPTLGDRELFPDLEPLVYCNHAAISPPSWPVRRAMQNALVDFGRRGVGAYGVYIAQRARLRGKLAQLISASADEIGFVPNTSYGVTAIAFSFPWRAGDRVVLFEGEFPANVTPWLQAAKHFELEPVMLEVRDFQESDERGLSRLEETLAHGARLVAVSAVQFQSGLRMPIEAIAKLCHAYGAELFVDAIQAVGIVPMDVRALGIDYLASGGHKWLMGPEGTGFLYVRKERGAGLVPNLASWLSQEDGLRFLAEGPNLMRYGAPIKQGVAMFETGCMNTVGFVGLEAAVDLVAALGPEKILAHVMRWADAVEPGLVERGFTSLRAAEEHRRSGILGLLPPADISVVDLHQALATRGVSCALPDGVLRFSPHWPNNVDEAEQVLASMDDALAELRGAPRPRMDDW